MNEPKTYLDFYILYVKNIIKQTYFCINKEYPNENTVNEIYHQLKDNGQL